MKRIIFLHIFLICSLPTVISAKRFQAARMPSPSETNRRNDLEQKMTRQLETNQREREINQRLIREKTSTVNLPSKPKFSKDQENRLQPNPDDSNKYALFLKQGKSGLIRLFPNSGCQPDSKIIKVSQDCSSYISGSSIYSFRKKEYTLEPLSDIHYKNGSLITTPLFGQGILATLGDIPLENVSLESDGMKFLTEYTAAIESGEALKQYALLSAGVINGNYLYQNSAPVGENMTYIMRVIAYRGDFFQTLLEGDERKDIVLAFRIVRKDSDNNITILWKELSRKESPKFNVAKSEKLTK